MPDKPRGLQYLISAVAVLAWVWTADPVRLQAQQRNLLPEIIAYADTVFYNGKILTADDRFTIAEAVAIRDGKILAVGGTDRIVQMAGPNTRQIDLRGKTVVPGIIDLHQHPFTEGRMAYWIAKNNVQWEGRLPDMGEMEREIRLSWTDGAMMLRDVKRAVEAARPGEVIVIPYAAYPGRGIHPCDGATREQLDAVSPNNPVFFLQYVNLAAQAMNTKGGIILDLPPGTPLFAKDNSICLYTGQPNGGREVIFSERFPEVVKAISNYLYWKIPLEEQMPIYRYATQRAARRGITLAKEHTALQQLTGIRELWARGEMGIRLRMPYPLYPQGGEFDVVIPKDQAEDLFKSIGNMSGIGDDWLRFVGMRPQGVGGNMVLGSVWTLEPKLREIPGQPSNPYGGRPGEGKGAESFTGREALVQAVRYGWDVSADHTVGDRAVQEVLGAIEEGLRSQVVKRPNQLLTMNHTPQATPAQIEKMQELGIKPSIGPWHFFWGPMLENGYHQYGTERLNKMMPMKSYINMGMKPALEGDLFIDPPFWRMERAISRKDDRYSKIWNAPEAVTRQEALWMSTNWPASHLGEEKKLGSIEAGKLADLLVIDKDYLTIPEDTISEVRTLLTMVGGKVVYEEPGSLQ